MNNLIGAQMPPNQSDKRQLITDKNSASGGGIGVSYSSVVLAGGLNPQKDGNQFISKRDTDFYDPRGRANSQLNSISYSRNRAPQAPGINNPAAKYDYNILNGASNQTSPPLVGSPVARIPTKASLHAAGSQMILK